MATQLNPADELELVLAQEALLLASGRPEDAGLVLRRAKLLEQLARYREALAACEEAAGIRRAQGLPADPAVARAEASSLFRLNKYNDSLTAVASSARLRNEQGLPEDWELSKIRGNCLTRLGRHEEALAAYSRAEQIQQSQGQPVYPFLSMNRGAVYQEMGLLEEALQEFDNTQRLLDEQGLPADYDLEMNRGVVLAFLRRLDDALAAYRRAEELFREAGLPEDVNLHMNMAIVLSEQGRTEEALEHFARSEQLRRERGQLDSLILIFNRALTYYRGGQKELAIAEALRTLEEASRQGVSVKPFYIETLRDWLTPGLHGPTPVDNTVQTRIPPVPDSEKLHDVFICYRRNPGRPYAMLLKTHLNMLGRVVFRDEDDLHSGHFGENLVHAIRHSRHMVVLLTPGFLERCQDPEDVARQEIATVLHCGTRIIPVMMEGFSWPKPEELPEDIRGLCKINAMSWSTEFFTAFIDKLLKWME